MRALVFCEGVRHPARFHRVALTPPRSFGVPAVIELFQYWRPCSRRLALRWAPVCRTDIASPPISGHLSVNVCPLDSQTSLSASLWQRRCVPKYHRRGQNPYPQARPGGLLSDPTTPPAIKLHIRRASPKIAHKECIFTICETPALLLAIKVNPCT